MPIPVFKRTKHYLADLGGHASSLLKGRKRPGKVLQGILQDTGKFARHVFAPSVPETHKEAIRALKKGMKLYNQQRYREAIEAFRQAVDEDNEYARGYLYLGNALYKEGEEMAGRRAWKRAVDLEPTSDVGLAAIKKLDKFQRDAQATVDYLEDRMGPR